METLQVQPAGAAAPSLPASTPLSGTPSAGGSFASTFGRALDDMSDLGHAGSSIRPKAPPRAKGAADNIFDSSSTAGVFLNCFITSLVRPAPTTALSTEGAASSFTLPSAESTADSPPSLGSCVNTPAFQTSASIGTFPTAVGTVSKSPAWAGTGAIPTAFAKAEAPKGAGAERAQNNNSMGGPVATSGQNQSSGTTNPMLLSVPRELSESLDNSLVVQPVDQQAGSVLSISKKLQTSNAWPSEELAFRQKSQASSSFADLRAESARFDATQVQVASLGASSQGLQTSSTMPLTHQTDKTAPDLEASDNFILGSTADHPEVAELSSAIEGFASQDFQSTSSITPAARGVEQAPPPSAEASQSPTPEGATGHPELDELSGLLGKFAGAEITVKVSGNEPPQAPALEERSTTKSTPFASGTLGGGLHRTSTDQIQVPPASKSEEAANLPAKATLRSAPVPGPAATEAAWQNGNEPTAASTKIPPSPSASPVPSQQLVTNSQAGNPATVLQKDAAPEATGIQPSGTAYTNAGGSDAHASLADASTSGQGKSGQQNGQTSGDNPANVITIAPNIAANSAADPPINLLPGHAPSVPSTHANTTTPQAMASSNEPPTTLSAWQNYDGGAGKIVRSASLSDSANGAEMHVELRTGTLGPLELHAVVHEGSVGAEIHVQGQEAHTLLAAGLPSLERALGERNLRVENISVYQDQTGGGASGGGKQDPHSGSSPSSQPQVLPWDSLPKAGNPASSSSEDDELANPAPGLSVRA